MTKKKRGRKERKAREANLDSTERRESEELPDLTVLPDPRAMERMSANIGKLLEEQQFDSIEEAQAFLDQTLLEGGGLLPEAPAPNTPLEKAQAMVYEALETESARKRRQLARRALKTSGDCADAYVLPRRTPGVWRKPGSSTRGASRPESGRWEEKRRGSGSLGSDGHP